ncbi:flocculation protein FLO11 [Setaria italica]|nr:flocculation protein FLO11 [Setaria italica]
MASAVASNLAPAAVPYGWLSPRVSFSRDAGDMDAVAVSSPVAVAAMAVATPEPAISKDFIDFEFSLGGSATMLPADELFADGKLLPLRKAAAPLPGPEAPPPAQAEAAMPAPAEPIKPLRAAAVTAAADGTDPYVFSPKAPSCSSRWRELLGLKRAAAAQSPSAKPSPSPAAAAARTPAARATNSAAARSLKLLLQRNTGRGSGASASDLASAPLLRDSSDSEASLSLASSRFSLSSSSSSSGHDHDDVPRLSLDSAAAADPNPPRLRLVRSSNHRHSTSGSTRAGRSPARRRPSPPPPPRCLSVDSPRMNSSGKIVFQGLERSSSSPCSFHAASKSRSRAVDRSYSSGVRVAPVVLNVPVCSRPVFGFFKDKKDSAAAKDAATAAAAAAARSRSSLGRKAQGWSGELPRSSG